MPDYTFRGPGPHTYPEARHSDHGTVGEVWPGEIRDLPSAPDHMWQETTGEDREALAGLAAARERAADEERFARLVRQLRDMGLNETALQQILQAPAGQGLTIAEGLAAGGVRAVQEASQLAAETAEAADAGWETQITRQTAGDPDTAGISRVPLPPKLPGRKPRTGDTPAPDSDPAGQPGSKEG